jgi:hypothetical protein
VLPPQESFQSWNSYVSVINNSLLATWKKSVSYNVHGLTKQQTKLLYWRVSATKLNRLMLFREIVAAYCENHTEHINTLCGQNAEFYRTGTHPVFIATTNRLMLFREIISVYCENHTERTNTPRGQNAEFIFVTLKQAAHTVAISFWCRPVCHEQKATKLFSTHEYDGHPNLTENIGTSRP